MIRTLSSIKRRLLLECASARCPIDSKSSQCETPSVRLSRSTAQLARRPEFLQVKVQADPLRVLPSCTSSFQNPRSNDRDQSLHPVKIIRLIVCLAIWWTDRKRRRKPGAHGQNLIWRASNPQYAFATAPEPPHSPTYQSAKFLYEEEAGMNTRIANERPHQSTNVATFGQVLR